jgi:hypothetical protein
MNDALTLITAVIAIAAIAQVFIMRRGIQRQLRAYVVCEAGMIFNVANPVPIYAGQVFAPTAAQINNPGAGPGVKLQIKNTGQTPAFQVRHWGAICFREFPLAAGLPARLPGLAATASVLGPGIPSTKLLELNPPLTPQQINDLRAGTGAVYVYGEITYTDAFGRKRFTNYRLMYHRFGGAIGVSTDLNFCDEGNEAA